MTRPTNFSVNRSLATVAALALAATLSAASTAPAGAAALNFSRGQDGAVVVLASGANVDGVGAGTIVAVGNGSFDVLTAKHIATFGALTIRLPVGTPVPARILRLLPDRDLAVIQAQVDPRVAATLHPASLAPAHTNAPVHVWGSGHDGPALERGAVSEVGADLPDGAPHGRYALTCNLCHQGDSGGGIFDAGGHLVGVFVGFFTVDSGRVPIAESVNGDARLS